MSAAAATIPGNISGLPVATFDFTAGSEDVKISSVTLKRVGLSKATTLTSLALFTNEGRISKAKDDSQNNNTEAYITIDNGGIVVKAGSTMTITVVADVAATGVANGDEFAIQLLSVESSADNVLGLNNLVANTMKVGGVNASTIVVKNSGSVSNVKVGETNVEIFKFQIDGASDEDVVLKSITFKGEGSIDESTELANYKLYANNTELATGVANGKYVTFNTNDFVIAEDKNVKFTVRADILAGVTETIAFKVDKTLDVTLVGTKYGFGASVNIAAVDAADGLIAGTNDLGVLKVDAGEVTLFSKDAPASKIRADKKDVVLGSVELNNVSGSPLELQKFLVTGTLNTAGFIDNGAGTPANANNGTQDAGEATVTALNQVFENFEVEINGSTYELTLSALTAFDNDLNVVLPEGKTNMILRADTKKDVFGNETTFNINSIGTTGMYIVEMDEEEAVTDITPGSLSFKKLSFIDSGATVSKVNLANVTVVRGAKDVVLNQFEIKADEASKVVIDEIKADLIVANSSNGANTTSAVNLPNKFVSEVALYRGSVTEANLLKRVSGSKISTSGLITFDSFSTEIVANQKDTFIITASIVDGSDVESKFVRVNVASGYVSAEDDDFTDVTVAGNSTSSKEVSVIQSGTLVISADSQNTDNKNAKTLLGGDTSVVYSADLVVKNESTDIETVKISFNKDIKTILKSAKLYLNNKEVGSETSTNIDNTTQVAQVSTYTLNGATLTDETIGVTVNGVAVTAAFNADEATTLNDLATAIELEPGIFSANVAGRVITITTTAGTPVALTNPTRVGTATTASTLATTTNSIGSVLTFDNMTDLIAEVGESELRLEVTAENIGYQQVGNSTVTNVKVTRIVLEDAEGVNSGKATTGTLSIANTVDTGANTFSIVPATLVPSVVAQFGGEAKVKFNVSKGSNTTTDNKAPTAELRTLVFTELGNDAAAGQYVLYREDDSSVQVTGTISSGVVTFNLASFDNRYVSSEETFVIKAKGTANATYGLKLTKQGVTYRTNAGTIATDITTNLVNELDLGSRTY